MRHALSSSLLAGLLLAATGCSGGSSDDSSSVRIKCNNGQAFCIISCDLGCSQTGCSVSEIAENQRLNFKFSDRVDPATVNSGSFSIRTATGVAPDGEYLVVDAEVVFLPRISTVNGISTFGFARNETYIITLAGGPTGAQGVKSLAGDSLTQEFTCTVRASLGVQDVDQQPPSAIMVSPTNLQQAPLDPTIVLQFSELIDTTGLQSPMTAASPIHVVVRDTLAPGECDDGEGVVLGGVPTLQLEIIDGRPVTVVRIVPQVLPGGACVTVNMTSQVRDLSGRPAVPAQFRFFTVDTAPVPINIVELFATGVGQDPQTSGGTWNAGARPGLIGGDGRHGSFDPGITTIPPANGVFTWDLTPPIPPAPPFTIPAANSLTGVAYPVTDGKFFFTDFVLPAGTTLKFVGPVSPQIFVRGKVLVQGTIDVSANSHASETVLFPLPALPPPATSNTQSQTTFKGAGSPPLPHNPPPPLISGQWDGQPGTIGQCGGGDGGRGAVECLGTGPTGVGLINGQPGEGVTVLASHAYAASALATRGLGSVANPSTGLTPLTSPGISTGSGFARDEFSPGGSGGGFFTAGGVAAFQLGSVLTNAGPVAAGGAAFPLFPVPPTSSSLDHFLVGGSGGGGGGSHPFGSLDTTLAGDRWVAGHGGTGGGGALAIRAGGQVNIAAAGLLRANGGAGVRITGDDPGNILPDITRGISSPGGGGSGGSFLLQSARTVDLIGVINTDGGEGSFTQFVRSQLNPNALTQLAVLVKGGKGSAGFYRLEAPNAAVTVTSSTNIPPFAQAPPPAPSNSGELLDRDTLTGDRSTWRSAGTILPPTWLRYELEVDTDGDNIADAFFTDSGLPGTVKANDPAGPVLIRFQGSMVSGSQPSAGAAVKPWREGVANPPGTTDGIGGDDVNGFRFELIYNTTTVPTITVLALRVFATT